MSCLVFLSALLGFDDSTESQLRDSAHPGRQPQLCLAITVSPRQLPTPAPAPGPAIWAGDLSCHPSPTCRRTLLDLTFCCSLKTLYTFFFIIIFWKGSPAFSFCSSPAGCEQSVLCVAREHRQDGVPCRRWRPQLLPSLHSCLPSLSSSASLRLLQSLDVPASDLWASPCPLCWCGRSPQQVPLPLALGSVALPHSAPLSRPRFVTPKCLLTPTLLLCDSGPGASQAWPWPLLTLLTIVPSLQLGFQATGWPPSYVNKSRCVSTWATVPAKNTQLLEVQERRASHADPSRIFLLGRVHCPWDAGRRVTSPGKGWDLCANSRVENKVFISSDFIMEWFSSSCLDVYIF